MTLPAKPAAAFEVVFALGSTHSGGLIGAPSDPNAVEPLENLAATLPEIFGTVDPACLDRIAARLCGEGAGDGFGEVLLLSEHCLHVVRPLRTRPNVALVSMSSATHRIGLVLSEVHARAAALEDDS